MPSRRALLASLGTVPVAGCLGSARFGGVDTSEESPTDSNHTTSPTTSTAASDGRAALEPGDPYDAGEYTVRVSNPRVRHGIAEFGTTHVDPRWAAGAQFLVVDVAVDGDEDPANLDLGVESDQVTVTERYLVAEDATATRQPVGFPVPTEPDLSAVTVDLQGTDGRWRVPETTVQRLGRAPEFVLESFDVPSSAPPETDVAVTLAVRNVGDRDGRFLAELGPSAMSDQDEVTVDVAAGETRTATRRVPVYFVGDAAEAEMVLRWAGGVVRRAVTRP